MASSPHPHGASGPPPAPPSGPWASLRAGLEAGALAGALVGGVDALGVLGVALSTGDWAPGWLGSLGCIAASALLYGLAWMALVPLAGLALHPLLRRFTPRRRLTELFGVGLGLGLFLELYWWTRPFVFYGIPAFAPERLAATAGLLALGLGGGVLLARGWVAWAPRGVQKSLPLLVALAWTVGGGYLLAQQGTGAQRGHLSERNRARPNVLLIVVDALRQDVLGCYGSERVRTPVMDGLAERGVLFEQAFVQAPYTWTSFGSILTGKYPRRHGLVKMAPGVRMLPNVTLPWHLKSAALVEGGAMRDEDWASGTFMTGTLSNRSGLMRGFDTYFEALVGHEVVHLDSSWSRFRSDLVALRIKNKLTQQLDSSLVVSTANDWLEAIGERRFVSMVHLYSTHTPYDPPQEFKDMYCDPAYDGPIDAFYAESRYAIESEKYIATPADEEQIRNLYYAGTTQADYMIGQLLDELEARGVLDDTLVILTADHGEALGEHRVGQHGLWEHNYMYQNNLYVPLILTWPKGLPRGVRVAAPVQSIDILPTVCDLMELALPVDPGLDPTEAVYGLIDGTSMMPLVRGEVDSLRDFTFAENGRFLAVQDGRYKLVVLDDVLSPEAWGEMLDGADPRLQPRYFDLDNDPGEQSNLFTAYLAGALAAEPALELESLLSALREYDEAMPIPRALIDDSDRDAEAALMNGLGYVDGVGREFEVQGEHP